MKRLVPVVAVLAFGLAGPALAQDDQIVEVQPCNLLCRLWRNVSGHAQVSAALPADRGTVPDDRLPAAEEGLGVPRLSELAATPGTVIVETPADRALRLRQKAELKRETSVQVDAKGRPILR